MNGDKHPDFFFLPGAGPMLDLGPYYIAELINLLGPVARVGALTSAAQAERVISNGPRDGETVPVKTPTNIHALLEFANGATVTLSASWDVWAHHHANMELYGTEGSLFVPDPNFFGGEVGLAGPEGAESVIAADEHPFGVPNIEDGEGRMRANYRCAGLADMAAAIDEGRPHRCNADLAVHAVDVMVSILRAGAERRQIAMTTTCERPAPLTPAEARALLA